MSSDTVEITIGETDTIRAVRYAVRRGVEPGSFAHEYEGSPAVIREREIEDGVWIILVDDPGRRGGLLGPTPVLAGLVQGRTLDGGVETTIDLVTSIDTYDHAIDSDAVLDRAEEILSAEYVSE